MDCAQRCQVAGPSVLAIPSSSPAPHREEGVAVWAPAAETTVLAVANAKSNRDIDIFVSLDFRRKPKQESSRVSLRARPGISASKKPAKARDPVTTCFRLGTAHDAVVTGCPAFAGHDT